MKDSNFDSYTLEDETDDKGVKRYTMWRLIPLIMTVPSQGWSLTRHNGPAPDIATLRFLLPVSLISGGAEFLSLLYPGAQPFTSILVAAVITFVSFFIGYYLALVFAKLFIPKEARGFPSTDYGKLLTMAGVGTLAIFHFLFKALPMFDFIIEFFPIWTIFLVFRGMKYADIPPEKWAFSMGVMCVVIICSPVVVEWVLAIIDPIG